MAQRSSSGALCKAEAIRKRIWSVERASADKASKNLSVSGVNVDLWDSIEMTDRIQLCPVLSKASSKSPDEKVVFEVVFESSENSTNRE